MAVRARAVPLVPGVAAALTAVRALGSGAAGSVKVRVTLLPVPEEATEGAEPAGPTTTGLTVMVAGVPAGPIGP